MGELQIFKNTEFGSVRTITVEGELYPGIQDGRF